MREVAAKCMFIGIAFLIVETTTVTADELEDSRKAFQAKLFDVDGEAQTEQNSLRKNYTGALERLEKARQQVGDLEGMLAIQKEKEQIAAGSIPVDQPALDELAEIRGVFKESLNKIETERIQKRSDVVEIYRGVLEHLMTTLTQAGDLEQALVAKKEIEGLASLPQVATTEETAVDASVIEPIVTFPEERPPVVADPFAATSWQESMTVPGGEYRLRNPIGIGGHGKGTRIFLSSGGVYTRAEGKFHVWGGRLFAENCRFKDIPFRADHTGGMIFKNCYFNECNIREEGTWYGNGNYDSIWYFENCRIEKQLHNGGFNIHYLGLCMTRCSVSRVELPSIWYRESEPVSRRNDKWLTVDRCVFEKCKVPMSFLLVTTNCVFIDCRFEDDKSQNQFKEPIEVIYYAKDSTNAIREAPEIVTMTERPLSDLAIPVGSILPEE